MKYIIGKDRNQTEIFCLEQYIGQDNEVRLIDLFVGSLNLSEFGFKTEFIENGRPAYHPADLLKLFIYGYMNRIRSSRALEKECQRNLEVKWLMRDLVPDHNTISNFRKDNSKAIRKVFRATVKLAKHFELIGGKLIAGDSTKLRAQNSKKNNFNELKIERHLGYIDRKLGEYADILSAEDGDEKQKEEAQEKIQKHLNQKAKYEQIQQELKASDKLQISTSDPDSRRLVIRENIIEVAYNIQTTVDAAHNIPIDFKVTNENDYKAMGGMVRRARTVLGTKKFKALYDKGFHTSSELAYADEHGIEVIVGTPNAPSHAPDHAFDVENFIYNEDSDSYTCPAGQTLNTSGKWSNKKRGKSLIKVKYYRTRACFTCRHFKKCTKNIKGRLIERSEHAELVEANKKRLEQNMDLYRKRQAMVEHPFGTIKRQWDYSYIMTKKTIAHASADVGLIFTAYNLRRLFNIIDQNQLKAYLEALCTELSANFNLLMGILGLMKLLEPKKHAAQYINFET